MLKSEKNIKNNSNHHRYLFNSDYLHNTNNSDIIK